MPTVVTSDCEILTESGASIDTEANVALLIERCDITLTFVENDDIRWSEIHSYMADVIDTRADSVNRVGKSALDVTVAGQTGNYYFSGDVTGYDPVLVMLTGSELRIRNMFTPSSHPIAIKNSAGNVVATQSGDTIQWTPTVADVYTYYCVNHPTTMTGPLFVMGPDSQISLVNLMILGNQLGVRLSNNNTLPQPGQTISADSLRNMKYNDTI